MDDIRLFASRRVRRRRSKGILPRTRIELSVKSMQSCASYPHVFQAQNIAIVQPTHPGYAKIFDGGDGVSCKPLYKLPGQERGATYLAGRAAAL